MDYKNRPDIQQIMSNASLRDKALMRARDALIPTWIDAGYSPKEAVKREEKLLNPERPVREIVTSITAAAELVGGPDASVHVLFDVNAMSQFRQGFIR